MVKHSSTIFWNGSSNPIRHESLRHQLLASRDLNEIADYFAENSLEAGDKFFQAFNQKCQQLVRFPNSGKSYATIRPDLRGLSLQGYMIFYRLLDDGIEILRVVSGRRNFLSLFNDSN